MTAGQSISVPVTFTPTVIGVNAGSLTANTTTGPTLGTTMVTLSGSGVGATSKIVASPTSVNFGLQPISGLPVNQTVTMTNSSGSSINIVGFTSPLTSTPFSITGAPANGTLANNASVTFTVTFTPPGSSGNFSHVFASIATLDTSVGNFGVPLSGSASPLALLALVPTSLNFINVQLGQSTKLTFNVEDNGGLPLTITSSTPPSGGVGIVATTTLAANTVIQGNSSVQETVIFTPTTAGPVSDGWVIVSNDGNGPATLDISGTGIINKPGAPAIGSASAGNASAIVSWIAPADNGGAPISHYTVTAADTTMSANGGQTCATSSSDSCTVSGLTNGDSYSFRVVATNSVGDGVASNVTNFVVPLPPFSLAFSPTSLDFGNVQVGENSSLSFTIDNTGGVPLTLIASTPPRANGFSATSGLSTPLVIAAYSSERESVDFTPLSRGAASASWLITGNKGTGQHSFTMSGRGIVNLPSAPTHVSASADYSSAQVAWHAPSSNGGDVITTYTVSAHDVTSSVRGGQKCTTTATTCEVSGLTNGDRYTLSVVATNVTGDGPSSNSSAAVVPALATLRIVTRSGRAGSPQLMRTRGDTNGGSLTYYTVDGTARGCRIFNDTLNATRGGSCVVVAVRSARGDIPLVSSPATRVMMAGKVASSQVLILTVNFTSASSTLSSRDEALLHALAKSLKRGVTVTVTGYSENNPSLAKARARSVTTYLHRVADVRVTTLSATTPAVNAARISWLDS